MLPPLLRMLRIWYVPRAIATLDLSTLQRWRWRHYIGGDCLQLLESSVADPWHVVLSAGHFSNRGMFATDFLGGFLTDFRSFMCTWFHTVRDEADATVLSNSVMCEAPRLRSVCTINSFDIRQYSRLLLLFIIEVDTFCWIDYRSCMVAVVCSDCSSVSSV